MRPSAQEAAIKLAYQIEATSQKRMAEPYFTAAEWFMDRPRDRFTAAVTPDFLRRPLGGGSLPSLRVPSGVEELTVVQSRSLRGPQIDAIIKRKLGDVLGTKWLMQEQECWYRPPRPPEANATPETSETGASGASESPLDVAILMVDSRPPFPYEISGTTLCSPDEWGSPRAQLVPSWRPSSPSTGTFQLALAINHAYAQLHGGRGALPRPIPSMHTPSAAPLRPRIPTPLHTRSQATDSTWRTPARTCGWV